MGIGFDIICDQWNKLIDRAVSKLNENTIPQWINVDRRRTYGYREITPYEEKYGKYEGVFHVFKGVPDLNPGAFNRK
jgi:hypothetical protein